MLGSILIRILIVIIRPAINHLAQIQPRAQPDDLGVRILSEAFPVVTDIAVMNFRSSRPVMVEQLRLHSQTSVVRSPINSLTEIPHHEIE